MSKNSSHPHSVVGFPALLALLFIGLKLGGTISWSWWWVLSPMWTMSLLGIAVFFVNMFVIWYTYRRASISACPAAIPVSSLATFLGHDVDPQTRRCRHCGKPEIIIVKERSLCVFDSLNRK